MTENTANRELACKIAVWSLCVGICVVATYAWGSANNWQLLPLSAYVVFPLLGLLAFSIMWSHYMAGELRTGLGLDKGVLKSYYEQTSLTVLVLLCAHPALLIFQRFRDGAGLPPGSYQSYVAPGMGWLTLLGTVSLFAFLAFEFRRVYGKRSWWHFVEEAGDLAMLAVFYHGLQLGSHINGWYRYVWFFMGITLVLVLVDKYYKRYFVKTVPLKHIK